MSDSYLYLLLACGIVVGFIFRPAFHYSFSAAVGGGTKARLGRFFVLFLATLAACLVCGGLLAGSALLIQLPKQGAPTFFVAFLAGAFLQLVLAERRGGTA